METVKDGEFEKEGRQREIEADKAFSGVAVCCQGCCCAQHVRLRVDHGDTHPCSSSSSSSSEQQKPLLLLQWRGLRSCVCGAPNTLTTAAAAAAAAAAAKSVFCAAQQQQQQRNEGNSSGNNYSSSSSRLTGSRWFPLDALRELQHQQQRQQQQQQRLLVIPAEAEKWRCFLKTEVAEPLKL
ncbi:hypothetical protein ACSSS7_001717 [Eimeria intestinalis]